MVKCVNKCCPYYEPITIKVKNKDIENDCCHKFHPRGYCTRLDELCDPGWQGRDCR